MSGEAADPGSKGALLSISDLVGAKVVIDTDTSHVLIGTLEAAGEEFITLCDTDVHDMRDSGATKELYALEALKYGVRANRKRVFLRSERLICVSRLEDVIRTRIMLTDIDRWQEAARAHGEFFGEIRPACTFVQVSRFIDEDWLVEMEADCVVVEPGL